MPLEISIHSKAFAQVHRVVLDADHVTLGRAARCDLQLPLSTISSHHMTLRRHGTEYLLEDMGSTNGTYVDGTRLTPNKPLLLVDGARIQLLEVTIDVHMVGEDEPTGAGFTLEDTSSMVRQIVEDALRSEQEDYAIHPSLRVEQGPTQGATFMLTAEVTRAMIGAAPSADLVLRADEAPLTWMTLVRHGESFYVELAARAQLLRDGAPHDPTRALASGEALTGYGVALRYHDPLEGYLEQIEQEDLGPPPGSPIEEPPEEPPVTPPPEASAVPEVESGPPEPEEPLLPEVSEVSTASEPEEALEEAYEAPPEPSSQSGFRMVLALFAVAAVALALGVLLVLFEVI